MRSTHSDKLERWLGTQTISNISSKMKGWYGPPIPLANVPGKVYVTSDGDFIGDITVGGRGAASIVQFLWEEFNNRLSNWARKQILQTNMGFAPLSVFKSINGNQQKIPFFMGQGINPSFWIDNFFVSIMPAPGSVGGAAPGGTVHDKTSTGALQFKNADTGNTLRLSGIETCSTTTGGSVINSSMLLYDRLFSVAKSMTINTAESITGVPTRYQNTTAGTEDSAEGNFVFLTTTTGLPATAHNWTICQYTDQSGNTGATFPTIVNGAILTSNNDPAWRNATSGAAPTGWFWPLASGDTGVKNITQLQISVALASGATTAALCHPIAFFPSYGNLPTRILNFTSALMHTRIFNDACLSFLKMDTTVVNVMGNLTLTEG